MDTPQADRPQGSTQDQGEPKTGQEITDTNAAINNGTKAPDDNKSSDQSK